MKKLEILAYIAVAAGFIYDYSANGTLTGRSFIIPTLIMLIVLLVHGSAFLSEVFSNEDEKEPASAGTDTSPNEINHRLIISPSDMVSQDFGGRK